MDLLTAYSIYSISPPRFPPGVRLDVPLLQRCGCSTYHSSLPVNLLVLLTTMASNMPLPAPPRTPTPPPEEEWHQNQTVGLGLDDMLSPSKLGFNPNALSPMTATFPSDRYGTLAPNDSLSQRGTPSTVFSPGSSAFPLTPASAATFTSETEAASLSGSEHVSPFNFQSMPYAPSQAAAKQAVSMRLKLRRVHADRRRTLDEDVGISTSTAVYHIRSSSNLPLARPSSSPLPSQSQPSKSTVPACQKTKHCDLLGVSAISS
jgi:hypothetical protein